MSSARFSQKGKVFRHPQRGRLLLYIREDLGLTQSQTSTERGKT